MRKRSLRLFIGFLYETEKSALLHRPAKDAAGRQDWDATLKRIAAKIHALAIKFLTTNLKDKKVKTRIEAGSVLKISAIDNYLRKLDLNDDQIQRLTEPDALRDYRKTVEDAEAARKRAPSTDQAESSSSKSTHKKAKAAVRSSHVQHSAASALKVVPASECCHKKTHCNDSSGGVLEQCRNPACARLVCYECAYVVFSLKLKSPVEHYCVDHIEASRIPDNWQTL